MPDSSSASNINVDINQIATDLNGKADTDLSNASPASSFATLLNNAGIRTVVETYSSGTEWYRVWSDGWCEQGGRFQSADGVDTTVNFLKPFIDTNYTPIVGQQYGSDGQAQFRTFNIYSLLPGSMVIHNTTNGTNICIWEAKGYIS